MPKLRRKNRLSAPEFLLALALSLFVLPASAAPAGTVTHLAGTLTVKRADGTTKLLATRSEVAEGDELSTQDETYARIKFVDGGEIVLRPNTQLKVTNYAYVESKPQSDNIVLSLIRGGLRAVTGLLGKRNNDRFKLETTTATIGIRGTHFGALFCASDCAGIPTTTGQTPANGLHLDVAAGAILVTNAGGSQQFNVGQFGYVATSATPPVIVPPQSGIQVTMPGSISQNNAAGQGIGKAKAAECGI
ncbi:MAG: FecR family protein [Rhodocyclaceae bacterium]